MAAICGSAGFMALLSNSDYATYLVGFTALFAIADSVIDFSGRRNHYDCLQRRFAELLIRIIRGEETEANLTNWQAERIEIEKDEPTTLNLLNVICHNEETEAQGHKEHIYEIPFLKYILCHFFSFESHKFKLRSLHPGG